jgi:ferredoxin
MSGPVTVRRNRTLLDALKVAGVEMMWDCLRGECGLCAVKVVDAEGELDHRDVFLSEEEQREDATIVTCVSRAVGGALTIDTGFRPDPDHGRVTQRSRRAEESRRAEDPDGARRAPSVRRSLYSHLS